MISLIYKNKAYRSVRELAKAVNGNARLIGERIRRSNWSVKKAVETPVLLKQIVVGGTRFTDRAAACKHFGLQWTTVGERIRSGWSINEAFELVKRHNAPTKCTGKVYRLLNTVTGKSYVGVTNRKVRRRLAEHIRYAETGNTKLARAMRKYSPEKWRLTILARSKNHKELAALEAKFIEKYDSDEHGYNTMVACYAARAGKPIKFKNTMYESKAALARKLGVDKTTIGNWLKSGRDMSMPAKKHITVVVGGVKHRSLNSASKALKLPMGTLYYRKINGLNLLTGKTL